MAYGIDNNRGVEATSTLGNQLHTAEGAIPFDSIVVPKGHLLGQPTQGQSRQDLPDVDLHGDGVYEFQSGGDTDRMYTVSDGHMKDDDYPSVPNPQLPGAIPEADSGRVGTPVNWDSVAPYEYGEFPKDTIHVGMPANPVPLT